MVALMLFISVLLGEMLLSMDLSGLENQDAFALSGQNRTTVRYEPFAQIQEENIGLTQSDMAQLRSLPLVSKLSTHLTTDAVLLLPDETPEYLKTKMLPIEYENGYVSYMAINVWGGNIDTSYLEVDEYTIESDFADEFVYENAMTTYLQMTALQKTHGITQSFIPIDIIVATLDDVDFSDVVMDGDIDIEALDAGREVLVFAPNMYARSEGGGSVSQSNDVRDEGREQWDVVIQSDYFYVGQELPLMQVFGEMPDWFNHRADEGQLERFYGDLDTLSCTPKVGAVLKTDFRLGNIRPFGLRIITTEKGAQALGLMTNGITSVGISLSDDPDADTEAILESNIRRIGMRRDMEFTNSLAYNRENRAYQAKVLALFGGMVILFFMVAVSMQVTNISRRIRADERMVGTLRAVGADERALLACYRLPIVITAVAGFILAAIAYLLMYFLYPIAFLQYHLWLLGIVLVLAALNALCSIRGVHGQLRRVMNKSIVENIREL